MIQEGCASVAMRRLLLLRHAKSSWDDPALPDHARPLNTRGKQAAAAVRLMLQDLRLAPDLVLVSSARRTLQTLEALSPWTVAPIIEPLDALYLATWSQIAEVLVAVPPRMRMVLVIGHNPGLHEAALALADEGDQTAQLEFRHGFPTAALAEFEIAGPWAALGAKAGRLTRFLTPAPIAGDRTGDKMD